jgi:hypothetical protein
MPSNGSKSLCFCLNKRFRLPVKESLEALSHQVANRGVGALEVQNKVGEGTSFEIYFTIDT